MYSTFFILVNSYFLKVVTATVETVGEMDIVANMPQERVMAATATAVTLTEEDVGK